MTITIYYYIKLKEIQTMTKTRNISETITLIIHVFINYQDIPGHYGQNNRFGFIDFGFLTLNTLSGVFYEWSDDR